MTGRVIGIRAGLAAAGAPALLTESMVLSPGSAPWTRSAGAVRVRATPQIAFVMAARLAGPGVIMPTAMAAIALVYGAVWLGAEASDADSSDVDRADGDCRDSGSGLVACGPVGLPPGSSDLTLEACLVEANGQVIDSGTGAAVSGHPAQALAAAANELGSRGLAIEAGWLVLAGDVTLAAAAAPGCPLAVHFTSLGSIHLP